MNTLKNLVRGAGAAGLLCSSLFAITLNAQSEGGAPVFNLDPFQVVVEGEAGYQTNVTSVMTRTNREMIDIPQSVDILSEEFLKDSGANMMDEAFVYVSNAQVRNSSAGTSPNNILIRGFNNSSSFTEGIDTGNYRRDMFGYERMEVIKGPASAVQGRGTDSGFINFVLKKPLIGGDFTTAGATYSMGQGGKEGIRFTLDKNFTVDADKGLYARVATVYDSHDHYIDFLEFQTAAIYPSLRWVVSKNTEVFLLGEFLDQEAPARAPGHGFAWIPALYRKEIPVLGDRSDPITALNLPANFNIGGPQDGVEESLASAFLIATHKFSEAIQYRQAVSVQRSTRYGEWWDAESNFPTPVASISDAFKNDPATKYDPNGIYIPVQQGFLGNTTERANVQGDLSLTYNLKVADFSTLVGYAWEKRDSHNDTQRGTIPARYSFINLKDPENAWAGRTLEPGTIRQSTDSETFYEELGFYIQQDVNLLNKRLMLTGGFRTDTGKSSTKNYLAGTQTAQVESTVDSWRMAVTYKVTDSMSLYAINSTQNDPTVQFREWQDLPAGDPRLNQIATRTPSTELLEFGLKANVLDGRMTFILSYFDIVTTGRLGNDRVDTTSQAPDTLGQPVLSALRLFATDGDSAKGVEVSLNGKLTERWDVMLAYGSLDTEQPFAGSTRPIRHSPEYNASVFTKYSFVNEAQRGLIVRAGFSMIGPFVQQVGGALSRVKMDSSQARFDFGATYRFGEHLNVDLMIKNAFSDAYIVTRTNPPREVRFSVNSRF
jgi:iron complex outermembrane receptor protein